MGKNAQGHPQFAAIKPVKSGFLVGGQVRRMRKARTTNGKELIILAKNKDKAQVFGLNIGR